MKLILALIATVIVMVALMSLSTVYFSIGCAIFMFIAVLSIANYVDKREKEF